MPTGRCTPTTRLWRPSNPGSAVAAHPGVTAEIRAPTLPRQHPDSKRFFKGRNRGIRRPNRHGDRARRRQPRPRAAITEPDPKGAPDHAGAFKQPFGGDAPDDAALPVTPGRAAPRFSGCRPVAQVAWPATAPPPVARRYAPLRHRAATGLVLMRALL